MPIFIGAKRTGINLNSWVAHHIYTYLVSHVLTQDQPSNSHFGLDFKMRIAETNPTNQVDLNIMVNYFSLVIGLMMMATLPWNPRVQSLTTRGSIFPSSQAGEPWAQGLPVAQATSQCRDIPEGDREVGSGSVGSRWTYEIFQRGRNNQFYVLFWRQNDCTEVFETRIYGTQNDAYQEFRRIAEEQAY